MLIVILLCLIALVFLVYYGILHRKVRWSFLALMFVFILILVVLIGMAGLSNGVLHSTL